MPKTNEKKPVKKTEEKKTTKKSSEISGNPQKSTSKSKSSEISGNLPKSTSKSKSSEISGDHLKSSSVLKSDELLGGGAGFLSGLGFAKTEKKAPELEEETNTIQDMIMTKSSEKIDQKPHKPTFSFDVTQPAKHYPQSSSKKNFPKSPRPYRAPIHGGHQKPVGYRPGQSGGYKPPVKKINPQINQHKKVEKIATTSANLIKKQEIFIGDQITVKEFSEKMGVPLPQVMKKLIENKILKGITANLDFDTASLIASELGITVKKKEDQVNVETFMSGDLQAILAMDKDSENLKSRAPIVTVMGHVDHGKTSLLDYLRKTSIAAGEAGGITQSIGVSMVNYNSKDIAFIDTPGHELFTSLRARGAKLTNIAVIVVAADDSVMPQTVESIGHAKEAGVPIIIAVTKIDKPGKNIDQIKQDLAKYEIVPEDWGGPVPVIGISSKTGQGIPELLEAILLQAEMLDLKYNPSRPAVGVIVDAHKDPKQGVVSTAIIMTGTLKAGDIIVAYNTYGKIRRMQNRKGQNITKATGGDPIQILGITDLPEPGRIIEVVKNEKEAQNKIILIADQIQKQKPQSAIQQFISGLQSGAKEAELRLILKSDGSSSLEALKQAVNGIQLSPKVTIKVIHSDVGYFSESDLSLAQASGALLMGYNITINSILKKKAESMKIEIKNFDIIYELTDYLQKLVNGMIEIEKHEVVIGKLEVLGIFFAKSKEITLGGKVISGKVKNKIKFRIIRPAADNNPGKENLNPTSLEIIANGEILSLHRNKDEVKEVGEGEECGIKVHAGKKIEIGDILEFYEMQEIIS